MGIGQGNGFGFLAVGIDVENHSFGRLTRGEEGFGTQDGTVGAEYVTDGDGQRESLSPVDLGGGDTDSHGGAVAHADVVGGSVYHQHNQVEDVHTVAATLHLHGMGVLSGGVVGIAVPGKASAMHVGGHYGLFVVSRDPDCQSEMDDGVAAVRAGTG